MLGHVAVSLFKHLDTVVFRSFVVSTFGRFWTGSYSLPFKSQNMVELASLNDRIYQSQFSDIFMGSHNAKSCFRVVLGAGPCTHTFKRPTMIHIDCVQKIDLTIRNPFGNNFTATY